MKLLILGLVLSSFTSFAHANLDLAVSNAAYEITQDGPITGQKALDILKALNVATGEMGTDCQNLFENTMKHTFTFYIVGNSESKVTVNESNLEPTINAKIRKYNEEFSFDFSVSKDFTQVKSVKFSKFVFSSVEKNYGTILAPKFETVEVKKPNGVISCKPKANF